VCGYNVPGFQYVSPCDKCEEDDGHCYLGCPYNDKWQQRNPCDDCEGKKCKTCKYLAKKRQLTTRQQPTAAS